MSPSKESTRLDASLLATEAEPASETSFLLDTSHVGQSQTKRETVRHDMVFHKTRAATSNHHHHHHHHYKHPGLGHLARSVSRVTVALSIVSSVSRLSSILVGFSEMILKGFGFVAFFAGVKASSFCIHLSCLVCCLSVVRGEWSRLFCGHKGRNLPEVSITSFPLPQFFVSVRLSKSNYISIIITTGQMPGNNLS
jgi:hypothetical protein